MARYIPIDEDPQVPSGAIVTAEVIVTQYAMPDDGSLRIRTLFDGHVPISSVLGLLAMGGIQIYQGSTGE